MAKSRIYLDIEFSGDKIGPISLVGWPHSNLARPRSVQLRGFCFFMALYYLLPPFPVFAAKKIPRRDR